MSQQTPRPVSPANPTARTQGPHQPPRGSLCTCRGEAESAGGTPGDTQNLTERGDLQRQSPGGTASQGLLGGYLALLCVGSSLCCAGAGASFGICLATLLCGHHLHGSGFNSKCLALFFFNVWIMGVNFFTFHKGQVHGDSKNDDCRDGHAV